MLFPTGRGSACRCVYYSLLALLAVLSFTLPSATARAQGGVESSGTGGKHRIQGRIYFPSGRRSDAASIKVILESTSSERLFVIADLNGSFVFNYIAPGSYRLTVDAGEEYEPAYESVVVEGSGVRARSVSGADVARANVPRLFNVMINLQPKRKRGGAKPGVINAALTNVPKPAAELYEKAVESLQAGDTKKAVEQLRGALAHYPEFTLALIELGVQYLKLGQPDKAAEALQTALKAKPDDFTARLHYGIALMEKKQAPEAEAQLREALKRNDGSWPAHMYLGIVLISMRNYDEAEKELLRSLSLGGDKLSLPHYYLGGIYWGRKDYRRAADELETYLKLAPKAPDAERLRATIKDLRTKQ